MDQPVRHCEGFLVPLLGPLHRSAELGIVHLPAALFPALGHTFLFVPAASDARSPDTARRARPPGPASLSSTSA